MVTYFTGINGRVQFFDGTNYSSIGAIEDFTKSFRTRRTTVEGIATRKQYNNRATEVIPLFNMRYGMQDANLLTNFLIKSDEGELTKFHLRYFDGVENGEIYNIVPDTVEVATGVGRPITVAITGISENTSVGIATPAFVTDATYPALTWKDTAQLSVYGTGVMSSFTEWSFRCNNNAGADVTGNVIRPSDAKWGKAEYTGTVEFGKTATSIEGNMLNNSRGSIVIGITDRQSSPITKTFTFEISDLTQTEVRMPMDLVVQRIEFASRSLTIT